MKLQALRVRADGKTAVDFIFQWQPTNMQLMLVETKRYERDGSGHLTALLESWQFSIEEPEPIELPCDQIKAEIKAKLMAEISFTP